MSSDKTSRRDRSAATRRTILRAAHDEFVAKGFHGATVTSIAKAAGVAPQTVYFVFRTKPALISAAIDAAVMGEDELPPQAMPFWQAMLDEPDAAESLRIFIGGAAPVFQRASALSEVLRAAAPGDEEVRDTHERHEELRSEGFTEVVQQLAGKGTLRHSVPKTRDVLLTVLGDGTYDFLATERGWSHAEIEAWWREVLPPMLLE